MNHGDAFDFYRVASSDFLPLPLFASRVQAGFPSPADDYLESHLDLNEFLIPHPAATFILKVTSSDFGFSDITARDLLIIDRSLTPSHNDRVVAFISGDWMVRRLCKTNGRVQLVADDNTAIPIRITGNTECVIWGVIRHIIHTPARSCTHL